MFAEAGIDVLAYDQRGFGESGGRRAHVADFDEYLDDAEILLDRTPVTRCPDDPPRTLAGRTGLHELPGQRAPPARPRGVECARTGCRTPVVAANRRTRMLGTIIPRLKIPADFDGSVLSRDEAVQVAYETDPLRVPASTARLGRESLRAMKHVSDDPRSAPRPDLRPPRRRRHTRPAGGIRATCATPERHAPSVGRVCATSA